MTRPDPTLVAGAWHTSSYSGSQGNCVETSWYKSSYSGTQTNCVETSWHKSSHSGSQTNCVEAAHAPGAIGVRDTKDRGGGSLLVPAPAWHAFTTRT